MRALWRTPSHLIFAAAVLVLSSACCGWAVSAVRTTLTPLGLIHTQPGHRQELAALIRRTVPALPMLSQPGAYLVAMSAQENRLKCRNEVTFSLPFRERETLLPGMVEAQQAFDCRTFPATLAKGVEIEHQVTDAAGFTFSARTTAADCTRLKPTDTPH